MAILPSSSCLYWQYKWSFRPEQKAAPFTYWSDYVGCPSGQVSEAFRVGIKIEALSICRSAEFSCQVNSFELKRQLGLRVMAVTCNNDRKGTSCYETAYHQLPLILGRGTASMSNADGHVFTARHCPCYYYNKNGAVVIVFRLYVQGATDQYAYCKCDPRLGQQLWESAKEKMMTDVLFQLGNKNFHAHKFILAARSPVFAAMFNTDMVESRTGRVQIDDVDPDVFEELLRFIYTGRIDQPVHDELGMVADKYDVQTLSAFSEGKPLDLVGTDGSTSSDVGSTRLCAIGGVCDVIDLPALIPSSGSACCRPTKTSNDRHKPKEKQKEPLFMDKALFRYQVQKSMVSRCGYDVRLYICGPSRIFDVHLYSLEDSKDETNAVHLHKMQSWLDGKPRTVRDFWMVVNDDGDGDGHHHCWKFMVHSTGTKDENNVQLRDYTDQFWSSAINEEWTDVKLEVGGRIFPAHRALLAARCRLLMTPEDSDVIRMDGNPCWDGSLFEEFLYFVYTGILRSVPPLEGLLDMAKFYEMDPLVDILDHYDRLQEEISHQLMSDEEADPRLKMFTELFSK